MYNHLFVVSTLVLNGLVVSAKRKYNSVVQFYFFPIPFDNKMKFGNCPTLRSFIRGDYTGSKRQKADS